MTNRHHTVLYVGVTSDLGERIMQHKSHIHPSAFTKRYNIDKLVYFELTNDIRAAISREKQLKGWKRSKKIALIETKNPAWNDLAADWDWRWSL
jgi:putative endonuclease